ncbi:MOSC domain-containing protein [Sulfurovum sp.]|uniref:MOSC domain-containing protein n=1 Tax=Sulfurovum sp. TaxID=1969726 RepID=UPI002A35F97E|nr:MOSC domain-containing protein [Sulfurovum sp.]MDD2451552.1 MOSC domain-containing protein [Sulfurovum sp.]MDD3500107.1 MOSC domain-containing protein [Sulfurovum sp.]MDY0402751.1 MOSC domain-containing protein [Sulfurovum sp.]
MEATNAGKVIALFITTTESKNSIPKDELQVDEKGILLDKHYDKDIDRSILVTSLDSYTLVEEQGIEIPRSALGENLLIDYNPYALPAGTQMQIGSAVVEISQDCTMCKHLSSIDKRVPKLLKNDRGVFVKVVEPGWIKTGDELFVLG